MDVEHNWPFWVLDTVVFKRQENIILSLVQER